MSTYSIPSSTESVSDEDNQLKARSWYEPEWTPEELGIESPKRKRREMPEIWATTPWVHHPDPARVGRANNRSVEEKNRRLKKDKKAEKREEEAEARREEEALRQRIKKTLQRLDDKKRAEIRRALAKQK